MKNYTKKTFTILLIAVMCMTSFSFASFAEAGPAQDDYQIVVATANETTQPATPVVDIVAGKIEQVDYSLSGKYPKFMWNRVVFPSGDDVRYAIRCWHSGSSYESGTSLFSAKDIKKNSYTATVGLDSSVSRYYFQVCAYPYGSTPDWYGATVYTIEVTTTETDAPTDVTAALTYPSKANNKKKLGEIKQQDNGVTISWNVKDPSLYSSFDVYRITAKGKYIYVGTTKASNKTSYTHKYYSVRGTFTYVVRAYANTSGDKSAYVQSEPSNPIQIKAKCIAKDVDGIKGNVTWKAKALKKLTLYRTPGGKKVGTVAKGTKLVCTYGYAPEEFGFWDEPSWVEVKYKGDTAWAKWSQVKMCWCLTHNDYAWSVKEDFANSGEMKSKTDYLIWVSRFTQRTNIFHKENGKWRLIKVYDCNTGNYYQPLKGGQKYISGHEAKKIKEHRDGRLYYFKYSTKFGGSGTFHTRCRWVDTNGLRNAIKRHPTTKGCCRLYDAAAIYVYNLPSGTGVYIH